MTTEEMARSKKQGWRGGDVRVIGTAMSAAAENVCRWGKIREDFQRSVSRAEAASPCCEDSGKSCDDEEACVHKSARNARSSGISS